MGPAVGTGGGLNPAGSWLSLGNHGMPPYVFLRGPKTLQVSFRRAGTPGRGGGWGEHVICFTKLPNRGMAYLVREVLGEPAGALAQCLGSFPSRETVFLGMHTRGSSKIS